MRLLHCLRWLALLVAAGFATGTASTAPLLPRDDAEVVEKLPQRSARAPVAVAGASAAAALSAADAATQAIALLARSRAEGDPRPAGRALTLLRPWSQDPNAPAAAIVALATVEQYLHDFDNAIKRLEALVARDAAQQQAWLTLATIHRLQGRYEMSDKACAQLAQLRAALHATACVAENDALRGRHDLARRSFENLLAQTSDAGTRSWLFTSLGELEQRAGRADAAERALRAALAATPGDGYASLVLADQLLARRKFEDALRVLASQPRSDSVLVRVVRANQALGRPEASTEAAQLRERFADAALRADAAHAREIAMFVLHVDGDAQRALQLAKTNLRVQKEPVDLLLLAQTARAAGDAAAQAEVRQLAVTIGMVDRRLDDALR